MIKLQRGIDKVSTAVSAVLCALMMAILVMNIILRYTPHVGGFSWYMESSQYLNVWSMLIAGIAISVKVEHLKVAVIDDLTKRWPVVHMIQQSIVALFNVIFYLVMAYSGYIYALRARQAVSTMPIFKMGQVYLMFPIAGILSAISVIIGLIVYLQEYKGGLNK